jgi:hypothetical protein
LARADRPDARYAAPEKLRGKIRLVRQFPALNATLAGTVPDQGQDDACPDRRRLFKAKSTAGYRMLFAFAFVFKHPARRALADFSKGEACISLRSLLKKVETV